MVLTIPVWMIVSAVALVPIVTLIVTTYVFDSDGWMDFSPLIGLGISLVVGATCWTGLIVWAVMR
jgi:hypothetical protein